MEATNTNEVNGPVSHDDEAAWRAHISGALEFPGSNAEYCRRNGLDPRVFRAEKKKFGATKSRVLEPKAFVKIESLAPEALSMASAVRPRTGSLPDPRWTAEFIAALMAARE